MVYLSVYNFPWDEHAGWLIGRMLVCVFCYEFGRFVPRGHLSESGFPHDMFCSVLAETQPSSLFLASGSPPHL